MFRGSICFRPDVLCLCDVFDHHRCHKWWLPVPLLYHPSLLPLGIFLTSWLCMARKSHGKGTKEFSKPYESGGKLVMHNK